MLNFIPLTYNTFEIGHPILVAKHYLEIDGKDIFIS